MYDQLKIDYEKLKKNSIQKSVPKTTERYVQTIEEIETKKLPKSEVLPMTQEKAKHFQRLNPWWPRIVTSGNFFGVLFWNLEMAPFLNERNILAEKSIISEYQNKASKNGPDVTTRGHQ